MWTLLLILLGIALLLRIITAPIRLVWKLALNGVCGLLVVLLINLLAAWTGVVLAIGWATIGAVTVLGLPGVGLLLLAHFFLL